MNEPYVNQWTHLSKLILMRVLWENGPTTDFDSLASAVPGLVSAKIEQFRHIGNNNPYNGHIYRSTDTVSSGGYDSCCAFGELKVSHRVNLDETRDNRDLAGGKYLWNGLIDDGQARPFEWFARVADFFIPDFQADKTSRIHVNCAAGASRAPSMAYFLVRATTELSIEDAAATVYAANSVIGRNIGITYWQSAEVALHRLGLGKPIAAHVFEHLPEHKLV